MESSAAVPLTILEARSDVSSILQCVQDAADSNRDALGFFPRSVYAEFASRSQLYVAVGSKREYIGHLMFDCRYPRAHVLQMYVLPLFRKHRVAAALLTRLRNALTESGFLAIYARVAEDLVDANRFWSSQGFYIQRVEHGGANRNRTILVRASELESPQLFAGSGLSQFNPLGLPTRSPEPPVFLLDLNVVYDIGPRRPRHELAAAMYQAERMNFCRLAVSTEARDELRRTAPVGRTDPIQDFIGIFPTFPLARDEEDQTRLNEIRVLVFPAKNESDLTPNDRSDLAHVATVVRHNLAGIVTNDESILRAAPALLGRYGIRAVSSAAFSMSETVDTIGSTELQVGEALLECRTVRAEEEHSIRAFLSSLGLSGSAIASLWVPPGSTSAQVARCVGAWQRSTLIGYVTWPLWNPAGRVVAHVAVQEGASRAVDAARALLRYFIEQMSDGGPREIALEFPAHQSLIRELAFGLGFSGTPSSSLLVKIVDGRVWTLFNWAACRQQLSAKVGLRLPEDPPLFKNYDQQIQVFTPDGNRSHVSLRMLESLLSPIVLGLTGRPAVVTPIRREYAEPLLGHSEQLTISPDPSASLHTQRHFISSSRTLRHFGAGTLMFFYESGKHGGRAALVALAIARSAYLREANAVTEVDLAPSVLSRQSIGQIGADKLKTVTVFESVFPLPNRVSLADLAELGCGKPNDLISTKPLTSDQYLNILQKAFKH